MNENAFNQPITINLGYQIFRSSRNCITDYLRGCAHVRSVHKFYVLRVGTRD